VIGTGKVPTSKTIAFGLLAACLLVGVTMVRLSPPVNQQIAHANREIVYDLDERHPPTPQDLREATAAEHDRQRTIALNKCANGDMNSWRVQQSHPPSQQQEIRKALEVVSACRARILGSNYTTEAHASMQVVSPGHVETVPATPLSKTP
jgi:hypothetical protein